MEWRHVQEMQKDAGTGKNRHGNSLSLSSIITPGSTNKVNVDEDIQCGKPRSEVPIERCLDGDYIRGETWDSFSLPRNGLVPGDLLLLHWFSKS